MGRRRRRNMRRERRKEGTEKNFFIYSIDGKHCFTPDMLYYCLREE